MKRRDLLLTASTLVAVTSAIAGAQMIPKAQRQVPPAQQQGPYRRPWVVSKKSIALLRLKPISDPYPSFQLLGQDGEHYSLEDVVYGILAVLEEGG